jgi:hypothetical protein
MDRWLQSFTSFCDLTVSGISSCCTPITNFHSGLEVVDGPKVPQPQSRFSGIVPTHAARNACPESGRFRPACSFESAGFEDNTKRNCHNLKLPTSPHEGPPVAIHIHSFNFPLPSTAGHADTVDHGSIRPRCIGVSGNFDCDAGGGDGGGELAIHRAAGRGTVALVRFILRCGHTPWQPPQPSNSPTPRQRDGFKLTARKNDCICCFRPADSLVVFTQFPPLTTGDQHLSYLSSRNKTPRPTFPNYFRCTHAHIRPWGRH